MPTICKANAIDQRVPLFCLDIKRCRASIFKCLPFEWVTACAADELVQATLDNVATLDFVWLNGRPITTATKWGFKLALAESYPCRFGRTHNPP